MSERPEIIANGPGEPAWAPSQPGDSPVERLDLDDDVPDEPAPARSGAVRRLLGGALGAEALAITGLVLAILPLLGLTAISRLGASIVLDESARGDYGDTDMATAITRLNAATALVAVALGVAALLRRGDAGRATRGTAGAAVLVGSVAAAISLLTAAAGPTPGYF